MHILQPKHIKLKPQEAELLLEKLNIMKSQLPKINLDDTGLTSFPDVKEGDIIKIIRKTDDIYYRVVVH